MSKYTIYYSGRKIMYRDLATRWSKWAAGSNLSEQELTGVSMFFKAIAKRFGLTKEFRDIGVL